MHWFLLSSAANDGQENRGVTAALIKTLKKIRQLTWSELYVDHELHWEIILSKQTKSGARIYSFRFSQKYRATALRQGDFLRLLTLPADHDSAYKK